MPVCSWVRKKRWKCKTVPPKVIKMDGNIISGNDEGLSHTPIELLPKKGSHSAVLGHFRFKADGNQSEVRCKVCFVGVAALKSNTTNPYNHLKRHHKKHYDAAVQGKKQTQTSITCVTLDLLTVMSWQQYIHSSTATLLPLLSSFSRQHVFGLL